MQHAGEERRRDLVAVQLFGDGDAMRGGGGGHAVMPQRVHAETFHLGRIAVGEDSLSEHQRHDAIEAEQGAGARDVGDRLLQAEVRGVHELEQARGHRRIRGDHVRDVLDAGVRLRSVSTSFW